MARNVGGVIGEGNFRREILRSFDCVWQRVRGSGLAKRSTDVGVEGDRTLLEAYIVSMFILFSRWVKSRSVESRSNHL
jgi:hypothetical protein